MKCEYGTWEEPTIVCAREYVRCAYKVHQKLGQEREDKCTGAIGWLVDLVGVCFYPKVISHYGGDKGGSKSYYPEMAHMQASVKLLKCEIGVQILLL